jgi:hypothetical protein
MFGPYFENKLFLKDHAWIWLIQDCIELNQISHDHVSTGLLREILEIPRTSKKSNSKSSLSIANEWLPEIHEAAKVSNSWVLDLFEKKNNKTSSDIEKTVYDLFEDVGTIIEGISKPFLYELYHQYRNVNNAGEKYADIFLRKLGNVIEGLEKEASLVALTQPGNWNVKLNDWRNIAKHYSWKMNGEEIDCYYGKKKDKTITLTRKQLEELVRRILLNTTALMLAHRVFIVDNTEEAIRAGVAATKLTPNVKGKLFSVKTMIAGLGFEVLELKANGTETIIKIKNALLIPDDERRNELFPAAIMAGHVKPNSSVRLDYFTKNDEPNFRVEYDAGSLKILLSMDFSTVSPAVLIKLAKTTELRKGN